MIIKFFELNKIDLNKNKIILFYGKNEGLKNESIKILLKNSKNILNFEEKEILENSISFLESTFSKSLFEEARTIIIKRATDKILKIIADLETRLVDDLTIILNSDTLDKKSKLRSFFEKNKKYICVPFYPDNDQTLSKLCLSFFQNLNIPISQSNINLIINKSNGDRGTLFNELKKIEMFSINKKKITEKEIAKLINLSEDHNISFLIDNCLAKNENKTMSILNENNLTSDDCVLITRIFLNKAKNILKLSYEFEKNNNIDVTINSAKPPIFWKDKEITKKQIYNWKPKNLKELIYKINEIELNIKKNLNNSINLITNFIIEQTRSKTNN
jgi:DNA polymerase-3 subunit delta